MKLDRIHLFTLKDKVCCTDCSFHNASSCAEDNAGTTVIAHDILIVLFIRKLRQVHTGTLDHTGKLAGREDRINIRKVIDCSTCLTLFLELLSCTRHD